MNTSQSEPNTSQWTGRLIGTNTGNLYAQLKELGAGKISGKVRLNDDRYGLSTFAIEGQLSGSSITLSGSGSASDAPDREVNLQANGVLTQDGKIEGDWETSQGTGGRFSLHPANTPQEQIGATSLDQREAQRPDQLHTARHELGPIAIDRDGIEMLAKLVQKDVGAGALSVISITGQSEASYFLDAFLSQSFSEDRARFLKIRAQGKEKGGLLRIIQIELGPASNVITVQSGDEAWARGELDLIRSKVRKFERYYATFAKNSKIGLNQILVGSMLVVLPSLEGIIERAVLLIGIIAIIWLLEVFDKRMLRHASIRISDSHGLRMPPFLPSLASWLVGILGMTLAALLAAWLGGYLGLPGTPSF